jgi:hypothetical protein
MSRNYKFRNPEGWYFVSFATVFWRSVFTRGVYKDCIVKHLKYCIAENGMALGAWIIMNEAIQKNLDYLHNNPTGASKKEN